ncbi:hypothetical protein FHG87_012773 [Trinorchestia longiramus]|nr:hypothetical protein FHG87_012773 [Trinorchestia longiramus]
MNFLYYKNLGGEERGVSSYSGYKKKKLPPKKGGTRGGNASGHSESCECDVCSTQFPLRTHLMLDMSYSRLDPTAALGSRKTSSGGGGGGFSFFGRSKKPLISKEDRRPSSSRVPATSGSAIPMPDPMPPRTQQQQGSGGGIPVLHEPVTLQSLKKDCFMIPVGKMNRFFPAGHPIPSMEDSGRVRMLETADPHMKLVFHLMTPCTPLLPSMKSPLFEPHKHQKECVSKAFKTAAAAVACPQLQGMVLMNLERECEEGRGIALLCTQQRHAFWCWLHIFRKFFPPSLDNVALISHKKFPTLNRNKFFKMIGGESKLPGGNFVALVAHPKRQALKIGCTGSSCAPAVLLSQVHVHHHQLGRLVSESACERKDPGSNPAADMVDAARNTAWDLGKQPNNYRSNYPTQEWARRYRMSEQKRAQAVPSSIARRVGQQKSRPAPEFHRPSIYLAQGCPASALRTTMIESTETWWFPKIQFLSLVASLLPN